MQDGTMLIPQRVEAAGVGKGSFHRAERGTELLRPKTPDALGRARVVAMPTLPSPPDPLSAYLSRLAPSSQRTMDKLLKQVARTVAPELDARTVPWSRLHYWDTLRIRKLLAARYAPSTANLALAGLRGVLREAWRLGQTSFEDFQRAIDFAPIRGSRRRVPFPVGAKQIERLLTGCSKDRSVRGRRDAAILSVLYGAGLRRSELTAVTVDDFCRHALRVCGKGRQVRLVSLAKFTCDRIRRWLAARGPHPGPLFVAIHRSGQLARQRMSTEAVARIVARRALEAGIGRLTPHDLRRAMATQLLAAGVDVFTVQQMLRHRSVTTTAIYDRRTEKAQQAATGLLFSGLKMTSHCHRRCRKVRPE
jgi:site-specific recombinase XerD